MSDVQTVFEAIRESADRAVWSKAVELTRTGTIVGVQADGQQVSMDVSAPGALTSRAVVLFLDDAEWSCDCGGEEDPCEHVAAGVIALRRARQAGKAMPEAPASIARIRYLFTRSGQALGFGRAFVREGKVEPFEFSLAAVQAGRVKAPQFLAGQTDVQVDVLLGTRTTGALPRDTLAKLFALLVDGPEVFLDDAPVKVSKVRRGLQAVVEDAGTGYRLFVRQDPAITEVFANGALLCTDCLHVLDEPKLTGRELEEYRKGRYFPDEQKVELFTRILPDLQERMPVELLTRRRPHSTVAPPRLELQVEREGDALSVLPLLVYGNPAVARVDGGNLVLLGDALPSRDVEAEERLSRRLRDDLGLWPGHRERFEGEKGVAFAAKLKRFRAQVEGKAHEQFFVTSPVVPRLEVTATSFELEFLSSTDEGGKAPKVVRTADPKAVLKAWREGSSLVPLLEGGFAPLPADWLSRFGEQLSDLLAAREARQGNLPASALPDLARLCEALEVAPPPAFAALKPLLSDFDQLPSATLPKGLNAQLRHYQQKGVDWLCFVRTTGMGALLADDMGLGKTLQAICALEGPALVVAPTSVLFNWVAELERFRPGLSVCLYHGPDRALRPEAAVTVTSYALLRLDLEALSAVKWKTLVLDEAQAIKNADSQVARAAFSLQADFRMALSGTPVENRLEELWSQMHFLNPGLLGGRSDFEERYSRPIAAGDMAATTRLRERIRPFVLRRLKRQVAPELPPKTEVVLRCELGPDERKLYEAVRAATREEVVAKLREGGSVMAALEALLRLRQASCHPGLLPGQSAETSAKLTLLLESLEEAVADGHKSLVFSQWTSLLDLMEPQLKKAGLPFIRLDGTTKDRGAVVQAFQAEDGPPVMLISLKAGGAGLNLTAADHVFLVDPWWNPAVEDQAADRAHRIGQERPVVVHRLVAIDTVEERILSMQEGKRALAEAALSGTQAAASLTRDDLLALLG